MNNLYFALTVYLALAIALGFGLWLYLATRHEIKKLRKEIAEMEQPSRKLSDLVRTEAIRLDRQGKSAREIAAALALTVAEVDLLLKLSKRPQEMMRLRTA